VIGANLGHLVDLECAYSIALQEIKVAKAKNKAGEVQIAQSCIESEE
jgi:hypothetical protein